MTPNTYIVVLVIVGLFFALKSPLYKKYKLNTSFDFSVTAICLMIAVYLFYYSYILPTLVFEEETTIVCGLETSQMKCYSIPKELCVKVWTGFEKLCKEETDPIVKANGPGTLVGPIIKRCLNTRFDKLMFYNRKGTDTHYCSSYFEYVDKAKKDYDR